MGGFCYRLKLGSTAALDSLICPKSSTDITKKELSLQFSAIHVLLSRSQFYPDFLRLKHLKKNNQKLLNPVVQLMKIQLWLNLVL